MKKQFLNLGKALSKKEQKQISGGAGGVWCKCSTSTGSANGPESSCAACFSYCEGQYGSTLVSTLCVGGEEK
ncbi:hypothetical protein [Lutibacter sp.]|uniref:hypothetical protein n=1 Tax=Lutibacter sp. TaxID=1925666 RepID=UPI0025BDA910|nr:hypothetical protein [Lutibacter sp.]MCF6168851.1 hypothetical protein [Lutibacter sp.]